MLSLWLWHKKYEIGKFHSYNLNLLKLNRSTSQKRALKFFSLYKGPFISNIPQFILTGLVTRFMITITMYDMSGLNVGIVIDLGRP